MSTFKVLLTDYAWPDLSLEKEVLGKIGAELLVAEKTDLATLTTLAVNADAIMTTWAQVPQQVIAAAANCRIVSRLGIGLDNIDVQYCTRSGIPVTNVPDYCVVEVAEHALAFILALGRKIGFYHHAAKQGRYKLQAGPVLRRIEGQTLGIVGLGHIGRCLAKKAAGLGMRVIAFSRSRREPVENVVFLDLPDLLTQSDYVSLHVPLTPQTQHLLGAEQFQLMKPTAYLVNTARGGVVDHAALAAALDKNQIAGAALDVQTPEPPDLNAPPYNDERVIVTPHAAFVSQESLANLRRRTAEQVVAQLTGNLPENIVNPEYRHNQRPE